MFNYDKTEISTDCFAHGTYNARISIDAKRGQNIKFNYTTTDTYLYFVKCTGNGSLYYYVGETVQNANLINAGIIEEKIANLIPNNSELISSYGMPSGKYIDLTLAATGTEYTAPADGYFWITYEGSTATTGNIGGWVVFTNKNNGMHMKSWGIYGFGTSNLLPIKKGEVMKMSFGNNPFVNNVYFRFYYAEGSN
jgi:hypothetical protein